MIIVVGLAFEARIAAGPGVHVICSGDGRNLAAKLTAADQLKPARWCAAVRELSVSAWPAAWRRICGREPALSGRR